MFDNNLMDIMNPAPPAESLWTGAHKIPWNESGFSRRMLREHLTQSHDMASRKSGAIKQQAAWIAGRMLGGAAQKVLDLGCGPGLYAPHLAEAGHFYQGIDFSPASIEYAQANFAAGGRCGFTLADVCRADFGQGYDLAMMLFGEINVFSPEDCARILAKAHAALKPGGRLLLEMQTRGAVEREGQGHTWYKSKGGLFSDQPHLCLTENHWYGEQAVALQLFHVVDLESGKMRTYRNTTQAYDEEDFLEMLGRAGFSAARFLGDWPSHSPALAAVSAVKK